MSRYIDADELGIGKADRNLFSIPEFADGWNSAVEIIANAPTADVVEVRHGEWITKCIATSSSGFEWYMHTCSNCGDFYKTVLPNGYKYCHNCGAKMDGERREE